LLATARAPGGWSGLWGQIALFVSALGALVVWIALVAAGETLMGLRLHPLFTIPAAFGVLTLIPLSSARPMSRTAWGVSAAAAFVLSLGCAVAAGLQPAYSPASPQRIDLLYFENERGDTRWIADTSWKGLGAEPIPASLIKAAGLKLTADAHPGLGKHAAYAAQAGSPRYALPVATVASDTRRGASRYVTLNLKGSSDSDEMLLQIPQAMKLQAVDFRGRHLLPPAGWSGDTEIGCVNHHADIHGRSVRTRNRRRPLCLPAVRRLPPSRAAGNRNGLPKRRPDHPRECGEDEIGDHRGRWGTRARSERHKLTTKYASAACADLGGGTPCVVV
jgi:hypothetical protein